MSRRRVVVTGLGLVTPLGHSVDETWAALLEGKTGAAPIAAFDASMSTTTFACEVKGWDGAARLGARLAREVDRFSEFAVVAADEAIASAKLAIAKEAETRAGCIIGTGVGGLATIESAARKLEGKPGAKLSPYVIPATASNLAAGQISIRHRLRGPGYAPSSACATGTHAIGEAAEWIRRGRADVMVAGSSEAPITPVGIGGFAGMRALSRRNDSPWRASRPFDRDRDGFVAGEGAGVLVLESAEHAERRGARVLAELVGYGATADAHHVAAPAPDGEGLARAMEMALEDAELAPGDVDLLSAHATSTGLGDLAEASAVARVFGPAARRRLLVHAAKSSFGHTLGAAGAIASAVAVQSIVRAIVPPTINLETIDPEIDLDVVRSARPMSLRSVLVNASGFGGVNASLLFAAASPRMSSSP